MLSTCESCSEDTNVMARPLVPKRPARPTCAVADWTSAEEPRSYVLQEGQSSRRALQKSGLLPVSALDLVK